MNCSDDLNRTLKLFIGIGKNISQFDDWYHFKSNTCIHFNQLYTKQSIKWANQISKLKKNSVINWYIDACWRKLVLICDCNPFQANYSFELHCILWRVELLWSNLKYFSRFVVRISHAFSSSMKKITKDFWLKGSVAK